MEELNLKKAIRKLKSQIKAQEEKCEEIKALVVEQKEKDEIEKQGKYKEIEAVIDMAATKRNKAEKVKKIVNPISAASLVLGIIAPMVLFGITQNWIISLGLLGLLSASFASTFIIYAKKTNETMELQKIIKNAYKKKDELIFQKSENLCDLQQEMDEEYQILRELKDDYKTLTKYANKKEPEKIAKGKIEVKKAKSFKENVDNIIEEDTNLLKK